MKRCILAIDQGTTSSRAIVFGPDGQLLGVGQEEFPQIFPHNGWVEHNPEAIWQTTLDSCKLAIPEQQTPVAILPQFQREEPDYPRKQESGEDYIARIRAEAAMWANGQGR